MKEILVHCSVKSLWENMKWSIFGPLCHIRHSPPGSARHSTDFFVTSNRKIGLGRCFSSSAECASSVRLFGDARIRPCGCCVLALRLFRFFSLRSLLFSRARVRLFRALFSSRFPPPRVLRFPATLFSVLLLVGFLEFVEACFLVSRAPRFVLSRGARLLRTDFRPGSHEKFS